VCRPRRSLFCAVVRVLVCKFDPVAELDRNNKCKAKALMSSPFSFSFQLLVLFNALFLSELCDTLLFMDASNGFCKKGGNAELMDFVGVDPAVDASNIDCSQRNCVDANDFNEV